MRNPYIILIILSLLFLVIPIIQQMIKVKLENKLELTCSAIPEANEVPTEYGDFDLEDMDIFSSQEIEFIIYNCDKLIKQKKILNFLCERKLESPPPQV